jgi:predicted nucleic acid-binding protein
LIVVSDTSPILNLARIGRLDLLRLLYQQVLIPVAVHDELLAAMRPLPTPIDFASLPWLTIARPSDRHHVERLSEDLDIGEAEAIVLAIEWHAPLLLVDERRGRRIATEAGLAVTGLLGVVAHAKRAGLIDAAKPVIDDLIGNARFWISPALYREMLERLDEA